MNSWMLLWTALWFGGITAFAGLALVVAVFGWRDLQSMIGDLNAMHATPTAPREH